MRRLVIDCASEACSLALFDGADLVGYHHKILGRGHAERLIPLIAQLPDKGRADQIAVGLGPGSFTGTRIGIAAARALGLAWHVPVQGFPSLSLAAATARQTVGSVRVLVVMPGGHGEWLLQEFESDGRPLGPHCSAKPESAVRMSRYEVVSGSLADEFVAMRGFGKSVLMLPDARAFPGLPSRQLTNSISALYARPPDAKLPV